MRLDVDLKAFHNMVSVAQDGSGMFRTIMDAVRAAPKKNKRPYVIYIKEGIYNEHVEIPRHLNHVVLYGEGPTKTRITGNINHDDGVRTYKTATVGKLLRFATLIYFLLFFYKFLRLICDRIYILYKNITEKITKISL
ncbi:putative pectinesterase [Helianthus annuus]|nr:putative pectinesterase [Helianthus annuus]